jgi:hypothetical protein
MKHNILKLVVVIITSNMLSCTKLDTRVYDQVTNFWETPDQIAAGVAPAYSGLREYAPLNSMYDLNELSSDEVIVPTRGGDWYDAGVWQKMWQHTWGADLNFFADGWSFIYSGVARINSILEAVNDVQPEPADKNGIVAELKTLRAFYYYLGIDLFGNIPIVERNDVTLEQLANKPRKEVFAYIEQEIKDNLPYLAAEVSSKTYGRVTKWFAFSVLGKLYLNAGVYTGIDRWEDCIAVCDSILQSNVYALEPDFFFNFKIANETSKENIFVIPFDRIAGLNGLWLQYGTLHYQSNVTFGLESAGQNGHCSTKEYYEYFDSNDVRRNMFLVGQQYADGIKDAQHMQYDAAENIPLNFNPEIKTFSLPLPEALVAGARCAKWEFNKQGPGLMSNDFAVIRLADIILMKAESQLRMGDQAPAIVTVNEKINGVSIRSRAGLADFNSSDMNLDELLKERARELSWEGWRRNDMIRFGRFTEARVPDKEVSADFRNLYPIPQAELNKNPYLKQNPGY